MARKTSAQQRAAKRRDQEQQRAADAKKRRIQGVALGLGSVIVVAALLILVWPEPAVGNTSREDWDLPALEGDERIAIRDYRGKPTVVAFFASWCTVCEHEIPELLALSEQIGDEVNFVGVNTQDRGQGLGDARKWGIAGKWPIARDINNGNGSALSMVTFGARGSPANVIYDEAGSVVHVQLGGLSSDQVIALLTQHTDFEL